jgi:hypothetical protein
MTIRAVNDQSEANQVARVFEEILATLPHGCASLQQKEEGEKAPAEVSIIPSNEASAQFGAMFFDRRLYAAFFGRGLFFTTYESPWELNLRSRDGFDRQLGALKKMCEAVVAGRCEHRASTLSLLGTIRASDGSMFRVRDLLIFHPRRLRGTTIYQPYARVSANVTRSSSEQSV